MWRAIIGVCVGAVIMVAGYTLGKIFVYSTLEYAIMKLPFEFLQGGIGAVFGTLLLYVTPVKKFVYHEKTEERETKETA